MSKTPFKFELSSTVKGMILSTAEGSEAQGSMSMEVSPSKYNWVINSGLFL